MGIRGYGEAPQWATDYLEQICADEAHKAPARLYWKPVSRGSTGQTTGYGVITITAPLEDSADTRQLLEHEAAHWIVGVTHSHDSTFYAKVYELAARYGHEAEAVENELWYKTTAVNMAEKVGLLDADLAAAYRLCHQLADAVRPKGNVSTNILRMRAARFNGDWDVLKARWEVIKGTWMAQHTARAAARKANPQCRNCGARGGHTSWCAW